MLSGAGVQMHAISILKNNRRLLKKKKDEVFDPISKNKFVNAPDLQCQMSKFEFRELQNIKRERSAENERLVFGIKLLIFSVLTLSALIGWFTA